MHRWLGVTFCLLFAMWFFSGMVLMYWDYPEVSTRDRLDHAPPIDASRVQLSPEQAYAALKRDTPPASVRLFMFDGRPAYRFDDALVFADDGHVQDGFPLDLTLRIASSWADEPPASAAREIVTRPDQWTVSGEYRGLRPLDKYSWPDGKEVYVSRRTGEVAQSTTRASRLGAYFGAIPHWLYFTPLRENGRLWNRTVLWASGVGAVTSLLGLIVGIWITVPAARIPYTGQKRWHALLGLIFGLCACTWVFSGFLSMEPFRFSEGPREMGSRIAGALGAGDFSFAAFEEKPPQAVLAAGVKQLDFTFVAGEPVYLASGERSEMIPVHGAVPDAARILEIVKQAAAPAAVVESRIITEYEAYYLDRHHQHPLPVLFVRFNDALGSMFYIDPSTAQIVAGYDSASRVNRWLYHGLHSLDFPWLYRHRPAWDLVVLALLAGGAWLCVTSMILAGQLLKRKIIRAAR
jgi:PepSY-associated TM region